MVFVYQGSGKKHAAGADAGQIQCKKEACAIQWCLSRHNYQEKKCAHAISQWKQCCAKANAAAANQASEDT